MADRPVFLCAAIYDHIADAEADYDAVFDLRSAGAIGTFDAAVIRRKTARSTSARPRSRPSTGPGAGSR